MTQTSLHCKPYLGMRDRGQIKYIRRVSQAAKTRGSTQKSYIATVACETKPKITRNLRRRRELRPGKVIRNANKGLLTPMESRTMEKDWGTWSHWLLGTQERTCFCDRIIPHMERRDEIPAMPRRLAFKGPRKQPQSVRQRIHQLRDTNGWGKDRQEGGSMPGPSWPVRDHKRQDALERERIGPRRAGEPFKPAALASLGGPFYDEPTGAHLPTRYESFFRFYVSRRQVYRYTR